MMQAGAKRLTGFPHPDIKPTGHNWSGHEIFNSNVSKDRLSFKMTGLSEGHLSFSFRPPVAFAGSRENVQSRSVNASAALKGAVVRRCKNAEAVRDGSPGALHT